MKSKISFVDGAFWALIPREIGAKVGVDPDSKVDVSLEGGTIVIRPPGVPNYALADLVSQITDENRHQLIDWGPPVGREVW